MNAAIFIALEVAALSMLRNNSPLQDAWFARGGHAFMGTIWGVTERVSDYFSLKDKNNDLALENHELRTRLADLEEFIADSVRMSRLPDDGIANGFRYTPATIAKISNNSQHNYIIISKGSSEGIRKGSGIITSKGAIGVIDGVSENFAYARSFQNYGMSISSRIGKTGAVGPLSWNGRNGKGAILKEIPHHIKFEIGDTIYTSGYSSIFPPDIPLGITKDSRIVNGATFEIDVEMFEDFRALRYITVVENLNKSEINALEGQK